MTGQARLGLLGLGLAAVLWAGCQGSGARKESRRQDALPLIGQQVQPAEPLPVAVGPNLSPPEQQAAIPPAAEPLLSPAAPDPPTLANPAAVPQPADIQRTGLNPEAALSLSASPAPPKQPDPPRPLPPVAAVPTPKPAEEAPLVSALRCLAGKRNGDAVTQLMRYDKPTQDLLLNLLPPVAWLSEGSLERAKPEELAHLMDQLESAVEVLRPRSPLVVERLCYCRDINRFGVYEELPEQHPFRPGEVVELYLEVSNFSSEPRGGYHEIRLSSTLEIRDGPRTVWPDKPVRREHLDRSKSPRHDHFLSCRFYIPETLRPGRYTLLVQVTDVPTQRSAQRSLDLRVTTRPGS